jgi:hypothetical protein
VLVVKITRLVPAGGRAGIDPRRAWASPGRDLRSRHPAPPSADSNAPMVAVPPSGSVFPERSFIGAWQSAVSGGELPVRFRIRALNSGHST